MTAEAPRDAAVPVVPPPPKLVCDAGATARPGEVATWFCTRSDGVRHGPFVQLYPDSAIELRGTYTDGQLDGAWERRHPGGALAESGRYAAGKQDGTWKQQTADGAVLGEYEMTAGTGVAKRWYESGPLYSEVAFKAGVRHGTTKLYAMDRSALEISRYVNGKLDGSRTIGTQRTLRIEESYQHGVRYGDRKIWQFTVLLAEENYDRSGRYDGDYTLWRNRKIARVRGEYDHGKRSGQWTWRDRNDKREREGSYASGKKAGTWTEWSDERVVFTGHYTDGKPDGAFVYYDRSGNELGRFEMRGGTGTMQTFHTNKKPSTRQRMFKGYEDGPYQVLTRNGKILVEGSYRGGLKHGTWRERTHDGVPTLEQTWSRGKLDGVVKKYVDGKLISEATYRAGKAEGSYVEHRDGKPATTGQFSEDRRTGTWTHHDPDGNVVLVATYQDGVLAGPYRQLVAGVVLEGEMRDGRRAGNWTQTDKAGARQQLVYTTP